MRKLPIGNDQPIRWAVTVSGKPFNLEGQDVHVYVVNSRGEIPLRSLKVKGAEVSGVFEGRYQTRLGEHSLILRVNEGRPEMKTASVANVFELVKWSADAGGSDEGDVIITPVLLESELSIGGVSYDDTELREAIEDLEHRKVNAETGKGLSSNDFTDEDKGKLSGLKNYDDTEIRQEIAELSAEVSGLSERIENLPSAEDEILVVEYGTTTFQEVYDAYTSGKYIVLEYQNNVFHINRVTASDIYFISVNGLIVYRIGLNSSNNWYQNAYQNEQSTNKVTSLSESSTDTQYPSAKAVYEALQNVGGGSEVFWATYGETTYEEIKDAAESGKIVICAYDTLYCRLATLRTDNAFFSADEGNYHYRFGCSATSKWSRGSFNRGHNLENLENGNVKVTIGTKTAEVATPQYVENLLGTIINGDY